MLHSAYDTLCTKKKCKKNCTAAHATDGQHACMQGEFMDKGENPNFTRHQNAHVFTDLTLALLQDSGWCAHCCTPSCTVSISYAMPRLPIFYSERSYAWITLQSNHAGTT